jgi:hypothetical protein
MRAGRRVLPGRVVHIRLNPRECMACVDVCDKLEVRTLGMSFAQVVKIAISSAMESFRQNGIIPERGGFEFNSLVTERFKEVGLGARGHALEITKAVLNMGDSYHPAAVVPETPEHARRRRRYEELKFKKENDLLNWTDELQEEFRPLVDEFFNF